MAHWKKQVSHTSSGDERVAVFELTSSDLDLLAAFYQEAVDHSEEPVLTVRDLVEASRLFAMFSKAADWTDTDNEGDTHE